MASNEYFRNYNVKFLNSVENLNENNLNCKKIHETKALKLNTNKAANISKALNTAKGHKVFKTL